LNQFADSTDAPIAQMVNIVCGILIIIYQNHVANYFYDILFGQRALGFGDIENPTVI